MRVTRSFSVFMNCDMLYMRLQRRSLSAMALSAQPASSSLRQPSTLLSARSRP